MEKLILYTDEKVRGSVAVARGRVGKERKPDHGAERR